MEENNLVKTNEEIKLDSKKLMRRSLNMIISFFTFFALCVGLFTYLQGKSFFIFNVSRATQDEIPLVSEMFASLFGLIIIIGFVVYIVLLRKYVLLTKLSDEEKNDELESLDKIQRVADTFSVVPIFLFIIMIVNGFFFSFAQVDGRSMQPTFCDNDSVIIQYKTLDNVERNDIVIIKQDDIFLIKRIVGLPGDTLLVDNTGVYINGDLIEDNPFVGGVYLAYDLEIPDGYFFVLGDNRDNSEDSRLFGLKSSDNLIGEVIFKISTEVCPL